MMSLNPLIPVNQELKDREKKVREGLELMIKHLDGLNWSNGRWISSAVIVDGEIEQRFRLVHSEEEALAYYKVSNYLDCRIRGYNHTTINTPTLSLVDIDREHFDTDEEFELCVSETRTRFKELLDAKPTELWTGNGVHFVLPQSAIIIEEIEKFKKFDQPSMKFLRFEEEFITNGKADPRHSSNISFGNCCLRIPGSLNSQRVRFEKGEIVDIPPEAEVRVRGLWDGNRPSIKPLMIQFYIWLQSEVMRNLDSQMESDEWVSTSTGKK